MYCAPGVFAPTRQQLGCVTLSVNIIMQLKCTGCLSITMLTAVFAQGRIKHGAARHADRAHSRPQAANKPVRSFAAFMLVASKLRSWT